MLNNDVIGLGGEGDIERAKIAAAGDAVNDLASNVIQKIYEEKDEAKKVNNERYKNYISNAWLHQIY